MNSVCEKLSSNQVRLSFEVEAETFEKGMQAAYHKVVKKINLPGFRKGKAPRKMIEMQYGESVFYEEAFDEIFPEVYKEAIEKHDVHPVDRPVLEETKQIGSGKTLEFSVTVYVKPEVTLGTYTGVEATRDVAEVTEDDVSAEIERARERVARFEDVTDRPAQLDDRANIDYAGTTDGVAFEGGTAEKQDLVLGSGSFIPGFEEQVVGMNIGEEKDINVTFPEQYHSEELAGKPAVFHVKLNSLQVKELPALDDEFAKDVSEFDTFEAYRADVRAKMLKAAEDNADVRFENEILETISESSQVDIPDAMVEEEIDNRMQELDMRMRYQGLKMEDFLKYTGQTMEQLREQQKEEATSRVKMRLVLEAIIKAENIEATDEDIEKEITEYAKQSGYTEEDFRKNMSDNGRSYFKDIATTKKAIDFLKTNAVQVEKTEDTEEVITDAE